MVLRKIAIDNSVRYVPISEQTKERDLKANTINNRQQNKFISQNNEKFVEGFAAN